MIDIKKTPARSTENSEKSRACSQAPRTEAELEDILTRPRQALAEFIRTIPSPLVVLGAGGKMGPTLAVLAKRAAILAEHKLDVIAVSRFSDERARQWLESNGVLTQKADLLDPESVRALPDTGELIYLVGLKFGTSQAPELTWAVNTIVPARIAERYSGARIAALSTGNIYPLVPASSGGAREDHPLTPLGEYANSAVARERVFQFFSRSRGTKIALLRLNYAVELRYGVLVDIARKVRAGEPIDLSNAWFNCIWQGDANEFILRSLALAASPAEAWNLACPFALRVRDIAVRFGDLFGREPLFSGQETETALLSNSSKLCAVLGEPPHPPLTLLPWIAHWVTNQGRYLQKPTHFETRDGRY